MQKVEIFVLDCWVPMYIDIQPTYFSMTWALYTYQDVFTWLDPSEKETFHREFWTVFYTQFPEFGPDSDEGIDYSISFPLYRLPSFRLSRNNYDWLQLD